jgi:hypothetical protein
MLWPRRWNVTQGEPDKWTVYEHADGMFSVVLKIKGTGVTQALDAEYGDVGSAQTVADAMNAQDGFDMV